MRTRHSRSMLTSTCFTAILLAQTLFTASAQECNGAAPGSLKDSYYELQTPSSTTNEQALKHFGSMLAGRWWGTQLEVICGVDNGEAKPIIDQYQINAEFIELPGGELRLEAERENADALKLSNITFSPQLSHLPGGDEIGTHTYTIRFTEPTTLVFEEKYRTANAGFTARLVHEHKVLSIKQDSTLTIERKVFVNGVLASDEGWILERDYLGAVID